ncbi:hypothetical protein ACIBO2_47385 [Nonomuraea sp. NPDC050022]
MISERPLTAFLLVKGLFPLVAGARFELAQAEPTVLPRTDILARVSL